MDWRRVALACAGSLLLAEVPTAVLQLHAWGSMILDRSPEMGLIGAAVDTLSGNNPCALCLKIGEERRRDTADVRALAPAERTKRIVPRTGEGLCGHAWSDSHEGFPRLESDRHPPSIRFPVPTPPPRSREFPA